MILKRSILAAALSAAATPALAHSGSHAPPGFFTGFLHPLSGFDHLLAMVAVGLFAALLGGRALWSVPASFVLMMLMGSTLAWAGAEIPAVEAGIAASIIALGVVLTLGLSWPVSAAMALVGVFAIFHGYAHGAEIPADVGTGPYSFGFALASAALHVLGIAIGRIVFRHIGATRSAGAFITLAGLFLALG